MPVTGQDILDKAAATKNRNLDITFQKNQTLLTGGLIGAGAGLYIGYAKNTNILAASFFGAVVGMIVAGAFMPK